MKTCYQTRSGVKPNKIYKIINYESHEKFEI